MKYHALVLLAVFITSSPACAGPRDAVIGFWASEGSIFEIYETEGRLYGQVRVLKEPVYLPGEREGFDGKPRVDARNPDPALQSQPIVGLHMFSDYVFKGEQWQGKIYDPESGNTYQSRMTVGDDGRLEIRGYIGLPMFGRTAHFIPATDCSPSIARMTAQIKEISC